MKRSNWTRGLSIAASTGCFLVLTGFSPAKPQPNPSPSPSTAPSPKPSPAPSPSIKPTPSPSIKPSPSPSSVPVGLVPELKKVMIVILENENQENAILQPFMKGLITKSGMVDNYHGITHPSEPNYLALMSGSTYKVTDDGVYNLDGGTLPDLLEARGLTWKAYADQYPGGCFTKASSGNYMRKHNPFISFKNISENPKRCANIVNSKQMDTDIVNGTLPNFSFYIPDDDNNGHDTGVAFADKWLKNKFETLLSDPRFIKDMTLIVTFDESAGSSPTNHIYSIVFGDQVKPGSVTTTKYNHYNLLRTLEDGFRVGTLGLNDQTAAPITGIWR